MAKTVFRKLIKSVFVFITLVLVILFLIGCLNVWVSPSVFAYMGFIGLLMPYLAILLLFCVLFWLFAKPKLSLIPLIALCLGWQQLQVMFAWHVQEGFASRKKSNAIRIVSWNVQSFNGLSENKTIKSLNRIDVIHAINKLSPDIVCLQEFNNSYQSSAAANNIDVFKETYPYYYFSKDYSRHKNYQSGCIIFSKYKLIDSGKIKYPYAESIIYADAIKNADTFRIFTTHLQSYKFLKEDYADIEKIKTQNDNALMASKTLFQKMNLAFKRRSVQANIVRNIIDSCTFPSFVCGDFNDVPNSYTYFHVKGNRQDAFLKKGFGIGRSFISLAPTLRIDYILPDLNFNVLQFDMIDEGLSDHIMLVADLQIKK